MEFGTIISFSFQNLWFLRPQWLWGLLPVLAIALLLLLSHRRNEAWKSHISDVLLPYLLIPGTKRSHFWPRLLLVLLLLMMLLALAGPTWEERERPGERSEAGLVVLLDASRSMMAGDIPPSRFERARLKIIDLLGAQPNIETALVAFAGTAHLVVPFTRDYGALLQQMEALNSAIMPVRGTNFEEAFSLADSLLGMRDAPGFILLLTDRIKREEVERIALSAQENRVQVMVIATPGGAVIPEGRGLVRDLSGEPVVAGFDPGQLERLGSDPFVDVVTVTLDDSDVKILALNMRRNLEFTRDPEQAETDWKDAGFWLLIPLLVLTLFWFRRGWMVQWIWLLVLVSGCVPGGKQTGGGIFLTADQKGQKHFEKGAFEEAANAFESAAWKGMAYAEGGELEQALEAFSRVPDAEGFYNQGVIYARMGDAGAALEAFQAALELDPEMEAAGRNLERVETVLDSLRMAEGGSGSDTPEPYQPEEFQEIAQSPGEKDEQAQQSDQTYQGRGDVTEMGTKEVDENSLDFFDTGGEPAPFDQEAARQSLLRQVEEDPSIFLRRKFAHQIRKRINQPEGNEEDW